MISLVCGLFVFFLPHLARELGLRDRLMRELGDNRYRALSSLLSAVGLGLIIVGKAHAPFIQLWQPIYEFRWLSLAAMIPSIILAVAGNLPTSGIKVQAGHPLLLGTTLWSLAHLWSNGDLASLLLFGSFGAWSFTKFLLLASHCCARFQWATAGTWLRSPVAWLSTLSSPCTTAHYLAWASRSPKGAIPFV